MEPAHTIRPAAFAGTFYPANPGELRRRIVAYLSESARPAVRGLPKAMILPHAGHVYSGPVAATGYRLLENDRDAIRRVILLGPSHRVAFRGIALSAHDRFATPLGEVPVDAAACDALLALPQVQLMDAAHAREHSLEVHLPFLQVSLTDFMLVPLVVGEADAAEVDGVLEKLWGGQETRIVVSSDLSHYHDDTLAKMLDRETATRIEGLQAVDSSQACGAAPVNGLLHAARLHGLTAHTLDLRSSGDTAGDRSRVVGYGAFAFCENGIC